MFAGANGELSSSFNRDTHRFLMCPIVEHRPRDTAPATRPSPIRRSLEERTNRVSVSVRQTTGSEISNSVQFESNQTELDTAEQGAALSQHHSAPPEVRVAPSEPRLSDASRESDPESAPARAATPTAGTSQSAPTGAGRKGKTRARELDDAAEDARDRKRKRRRT